jgi:hypothetical protein
MAEQRPGDTSWLRAAAADAQRAATKERLVLDTATNMYYNPDTV